MLMSENVRGLGNEVQSLRETNKALLHQNIILRNWIYQKSKGTESQSNCHNEVDRR